MTASLPEPTMCALCAAPLTAGPIADHEDSGTHYRLYACPSCAAQFWWPLKNPGATWYERDERYADRNQDPILAPNKKHRDVLKAIGKPGRVLDVGCGVGNFLAYAELQGWEAWGIDFDHDAIESGKRAFGLSRLSVDDLGSFATTHPNERFDLITFFDVFEHLDDHNEFLDTVRSMLAPGGRIGLSVPYRHGWRWFLPHDLPPRHLTRWDETSLARIFARHGFTLETVFRLPASLEFIMLKFRFHYGRWSSVGLVRAAAKQSNGSAPRAQSLRMQLVRVLARTKDIVLFGIPALLVWSALLLTRARYTDITVVATLTPHKEGRDSDSRD